MSMKKWLTFIILGNVLIGIVWFSLSRTEDRPSEYPTEDKASDGDKKIELVFWRNKGNTAENNAYKELIKMFEAKYPNITINMQSIHYGDYEVKLRTEFSTGNNPPDIVAIDSPNLALYANAGMLLSLDQYMREEGNIDDIPELTLKGLIYNSELYLAPLVESSIALFYNKHLFKEAGVPFPSRDPNNPLTWEEVRKIAIQITDVEKGIYGIDPAQGFGIGETAAYFKMPFLWQFGGEILNTDTKTASGYLDSKQSLQALNFYQNLYHKDGVASVELPSGAFERGKLAMTVIGSWALNSFNSYPDFNLGEDFGVAPLPKQNYQVTPNGGWSLGISKQTEYPEEAWKFIQYVTSYEGIKKYVEITGDIPARYSVARDLPEFNEYPRDIFIEQAHNYSRNRPITPAYPVVSDAIKRLFEDVGIGNKDVNVSVEEAVERINRGLKELE